MRVSSTLSRGACSQRCGPVRPVAPSRAVLNQIQPQHARSLSLRATKGEGKGGIDGIVAAGNKLVDSGASLVPESVPRPVARAGVTVAMGLFAFGVLKQLVSGVITLVVLGAVAYYFFTRGGDDDDDDGPSSKRSSKQDDDLGDPLSDARRIMDKYK